MFLVVSRRFRGNLTGRLTTKTSYREKIGNGVKSHISEKWGGDKRSDICVFRHTAIYGILPQYIFSDILIGTEVPVLEFCLKMRVAK